MSEKFGMPEHFGAINKNLTPSQEIKKDPGLEKAEKINMLLKEKHDLLESGPTAGNEIEFENKLTDLESMLTQLQGQV